MIKKCSECFYARGDDPDHMKCSHEKTLEASGAMKYCSSCRRDYKWTEDAQCGGEAQFFKQIDQKRECHFCKHCRIKTEYRKELYCIFYTDNFGDAQKTNFVRRNECEHGYNGFEPILPKRPLWKFFKR